MEEKLFTVGQMAEICNISPETLRHYDRMGVLSPLGRGDNKYRYYTMEQINDIMVIKELKSIGIPLKTISEYIKHKDLGMIRSTLEASLRVQREELAEMQRRYDSLVDRLISLNDAFTETHIARSQKDKPIRESFCIVPFAERPIISCRGISNCYVGNHYLYRYVELQNLIEEDRISVGRSWYIVFHDHYSKQFDEGEDAMGDMEFFANVNGSTSGSSHCRMFGGFLTACATYIGPYVNTKHVYEELTEWAQSIGYTVSGVSFQELIVGRFLTDREEDFVTRIYLPLNQKTI